MLLRILISIFLISVLNISNIYGNKTDNILSPEKVIRIAERLLKLTLNTSHAQMSHCMMMPRTFQQEPTLHFHVNVISRVFDDMPTYVRRNITNNLLRGLMDRAGPNDLSLDCFSNDERPDGFIDDDLEHLEASAFGEHVIQDIMEEEFNKTFIPEFFYVENVCEHFGIDRAHESHFQIFIVSDRFDHKSMAERRLMVDNIVKRTMMHGLARLFLKLYTPEEFKIEKDIEKRAGSPRPLYRNDDSMRQYNDMEG